MLRSNKFDIVRVGIVGTGRIAPRFIAESKYVSGLSIECAYNPDKKVQRSFKKHEIKVFTDDYDEFLKYVDAVYIASPNETHIICMPKRRFIIKNMY